MPNNNLPTIAQLQDPAWLKSQSQRVQTAVFHATEGKHRAKNDVIKKFGNAWDKRLERYGMLQYQNRDQNGNIDYAGVKEKYNRMGLDVPVWAQQGQQQPPAATTTTGGNTTSNGGGGQGRNVRFDQRISKFDRARGTSAGGVTQSGTPLSNSRDATAEARDSAATTTPRPSTSGSVIGTTSSMGAANTRSPFNTPATPPAWLTPTPSQPWLPNANSNSNTGNGGGNTPRLPSGLPNGVPNWALPAAPRIPTEIPPVTIPSGLPAAPRIPSGIPANTGNYVPVSSARREPSIPAGVMPGGGFANNANGGTVYYSPDGKRYWVAPDGRFIPSQTNQNNLVGGSDIGTAYDQAALARLAYARTMSGYLQPLASTPSTFGSYYGGGFGGGYGGGGGGGGYTSYDPYNSNPSWYNSLDLTAWNIQ